MAKDLFSKQSQIYAKYRPTYPAELFEYILGFVKEKGQAWDCATGNGQAASVLAEYFEKVEATDFSQSQLNNAVAKPNITYHTCPAEKTPFDDDSFDLITVATAYHWLDWDAFATEAKRVGKKEGVIAVWSYNLLTAHNENLDKLIHHFYNDITGPYWDERRRYVDEAYTTIPFDFEPLPAKNFNLTVQWTKDQLMGYLSSWSATQTYMDKKGVSPLSLIEEELTRIWGDDETTPFTFPLFLKVGRFG